MRIIGTRSDKGDWDWSENELYLVSNGHSIMAMPDVSEDHIRELKTATQKRMNEIFETYVDFGPLP